ncbi:hypothetical protein [Paenibacillus silvae]|uniref:hypothetical protein n=1 Tax=Paenibacillus silvae TaxID=1325358 RepID=UPI00142D30C0|nr:hypothetical protein [Paenibacillus silvae]
MRYKKRYEYKTISRYQDEEVAVSEELIEEQILNWMEFVLLNYSVENKIENKQNPED